MTDHTYMGFRIRSPWLRFKVAYAVVWIASWIWMLPFMRDEWFQPIFDALLRWIGNGISLEEINDDA